MNGGFLGLGMGTDEDAVYKTLERLQRRKRAQGAGRRLSEKDRRDAAERARQEFSGPKRRRRQSA